MMVRLCVRVVVHQFRCLPLGVLRSHATHHNRSMLHRRCRRHRSLLHLCHRQQFALAPVAYPVAYGPRSAPRALWGFILTLMAGILVILNAGALLSWSFYNMWVSAFFWIPIIDNSPPHGLIFVIGAIVGLISVDRFDFDVAWVRYYWKHRRLPHGCAKSDNWRGICSRLRSWCGGRNTRHARKIETPTPIQTPTPIHFPSMYITRTIDADQDYNSLSSSRNNGAG